ncbi:MAG: glycoside hydrolase family 13 protein [Bacteroidota bacterium]|jgi:glycosidase
MSLPKFRVMMLLLLLLSGSLGLAQRSFVPDWVKDAVFYQIFPERFANGDTTNDPPDVQPWGEKPTTTNYFGGDLKGIINYLDYLQRLGVNALYLNPIFESPSNHKYHTSDYMKIDHNFGDDKTFKKLLDECHVRGIHVVIDAVFNHTGVHFWAFEDVKKNEAKSKYLHWYNIHGFPVGPPDKPNYEAWWGMGDLPKLMTDTPEVRQYLFEATKHWMKLGLDGWRLDVPNEMSHNFWIEWRKLVKAENPDAYIVGEIWDDATPWLKGDQFDAVMNYRFRGACVGFIALENLSAFQFDSILQVQRSQYPSEVNYVLQNLIGSHDTERFLTLCNGDVGKLKLAALMQMAYMGAPMVYYGDEIGMKGGKDPDCRHTMIWDTSKWNMDLFGWYQKLIGIRNTHPVFRRGSFKTIMVDNDKKVFGFMREDRKEKALVVLNIGDQVDTLSFPTSSKAKWVDLLGGKTKKIVNHNVFPVPARSGIVFISVKE